ncbi:MAG TPA: ABC transporter substrate-binding protein [Hyphomicrobiales bacterium]|nr:ABC transporter substrate-binding protein [Hyphomicrobiales bacterium]
MRGLSLLAVWASCAWLALGAPVFAQGDLKTIRVGFCAKTISSAASPFAIATKFGWFAKAGMKVDLVPLAGSTDCVKFVATKDLDFSLPSIEPLAIIRAQGVKMKNYYTAYQSNIYGIAVPAESPIKDIADLRGKKIGVTSMASGGVIVVRALLAEQGMDPNRDASIIVVGEAAQAAALARSRQADALALYDTQFALVENAGVKLRFLPAPSITHFPSNGFVALEETLNARKAVAVALAQNYAKGEIFAIVNPEAAVRILYEIYPFTKPTGKSEADAIREDVITLNARMKNWLLEPAGVTKWGENSLANYSAYIDWLIKNGVLKDKPSVTDLVTNDLIDEINNFDQAEIERHAKSYTPG